MAKFEREELAGVLDDFAKKVIQQARRNLTIFSGNKTRALYNSFTRDLATFKNIISVAILSNEYNEYGIYQDYGVGGTVSSPINLKPSPSGRRFRYISKGGLKGMPPPAAFKTDKINRPVSDSRAFATAVNIFKYGFKATEFFSRPFETAYTKILKEIEEVYGADVQKHLVAVLEVERKGKSGK